MIPGQPAVLLAVGVCAVVTGFGPGGPAASADVSAVGAPGNCTASPRNATPKQSGSATIVVRTTRGANANLLVRYPATTRTFTIVADSAGTAVVTFPISRSVPGTPVQVDVSTNSGQLCSTQFTPQ